LEESQCPEVVWLPKRHSKLSLAGMPDPKSVTPAPASEARIEPAEYPRERICGSMRVREIAPDRVKSTAGRKSWPLVLTCRERERESCECV